MRLLSVFTLLQMNKGKNIIVTGGLGFIGSHTVVSLIENGYNPIIIDDCRNSEPFIHKELEDLTNRQIEWIKDDYRNFSSYRSQLYDTNTVGIIHFAAYMSVGESVSAPLKYYDNNVAGFVELLQEVERTNIKNIVFSSSCTIYGQPDENPVSEHAPVQPPQSPYGATKQMCEQILKDFSNANTAFKSIALRYFNPVGAHHSHQIGELPLSKPNNLMPAIVLAAQGKIEELTIFGDDYNTPDGTCVRDYLHVEDLANAHVRAMDFLLNSSTENYTYLNLGTGKGLSVLEVINSFITENNVDLSYKLGERRPGDVESVYANTSQAEKVLGWKAEKTLKDMVVDVWQWTQYLSKTHGIN